MVGVDNDKCSAEELRQELSRIFGLFIDCEQWGQCCEVICDLCEVKTGEFYDLERHTETNCVHCVPF